MMRNSKSPIIPDHNPSTPFDLELVQKAYDCAEMMIQSKQHNANILPIARDTQGFKLLKGAVLDSELTIILN